MSDPERLLDNATDAEARLLSSALDEPPPADLLARTLDAVAVATSAAMVASTVSSGSLKAGAAASANAAGGGILSAIGIGTLAGLLTIGAYEVVTTARAPQPNSAVPAMIATIAPSAPTARAPMDDVTPPAPNTAPSATPSAPVPVVVNAPPSSTLAIELGLLDDARSALRAGDRARARALLDRYAREIPRGQLGREAAVLRAEIDASVDGGN